MAGFGASFVDFYQSIRKVVLTAGTAIAGKMYITDGTDDVAVQANNGPNTDIDGLVGLVTASGIYARVDVNTLKPVEMDGSTHALLFVDYAHHEIHEGDAFVVEYDNTTAATDDHRSAIGFTTSNTTNWLHLVIEVYASAASEFFLEESPTIDDDAGTQALIYNRNRNSATTSGVLSLETSPTANYVTTFNETEIAAATYSAGTILPATTVIGTGERVLAIGGNSRGTQEWDLKQNTKYLFRVQNTGATATRHVITLSWYEHTDID